MESIKKVNMSPIFLKELQGEAVLKLEVKNPALVW